MAVKKKRAVKKRPSKKRVAKKRVSKKRVNKKRVAISAPSRTTGHAPTKRLKRRRQKNVRPGFYPNPSARGYQVAAVVGRRLGFATGVGVDTDRSKAAIFPTVKNAEAVAKALYPHRDITRVAVVPVKTALTEVRQSMGLGGPK